MAVKLVFLGKLADLAIVDGNPLEDITATTRVRYTIANGRVFVATYGDVEPLREYGGDARPACRDGANVRAGHNLGRHHGQRVWLPQ